MPVLCGNRHAHATPTYHTDSDTVRLCFASPTSVGAPPRRGWLREAQEARAEIDASVAARRKVLDKERAAFLDREAKLHEIGLYEGTDSDTVKCGRCGGTGEFVTGMVNGKLVGPGGICFRCSGKGRQTDCGHAQHRLRAIALVDNPDTADWSGCCDRVRNDLYDRFGIRWNI